MAQKNKVLVWVADTELRIRLVNVINRSGKFLAVEYRSGAGELEPLYLQKPDYVLIDVDYAIKEPEKVVEAIRNKLAGVHIIGLSYRWDELKRKKFAEFFDTILVTPFDADSFERAIEEADSKSTSDKCTVLAFFAPKGKSGRTTLAVNLALSLARNSGARVGIIDAETNFADMDAFLNLNPQSTIVEAIRDLEYLTPSALNKYFEEVSSNVQVLCGVKSPRQSSYISGDGLSKLIRLAKRNFDYVLVDIAPGFNQVSIAACEAADVVYITAMSGGAFELQHINRCLEIFRSLKNWEQRVKCVLTRIKPDTHRQGELAAELGLSSENVILLPNEYLLCSQAANNGRMALDIGPSSVLTQEIDRMAQDIIEHRQVSL